MTTSNDREHNQSKSAHIVKEGRKRYIRELANQLGMLEQFLDQYQHGQDVAVAQQIYRIIHSMKGSAPIFGFARIGKLAETMVQPWEWTQEGKPGPLHMEVDELVMMTAEARLHIQMEYDIIHDELHEDETGEDPEQRIQDRKQFRLLLVDDDDTLRFFLAQRLQAEGYQVDEASNVTAAKKLLRENVYDLITLDLMMHPESGYVLFDFLKEDPTFKWIPLIVLSGREDVKDKVRCYRLGADQYMTKPFHYEELEAGIYRLLTRSRHFEQLAFRDALTGVFNRRYFDHQLQLELEKMERSPAVISLAFLDIDRFKRINDEYGHSIGDLVLQGLGHRLQQELRNHDLLARYGGEEFVVAFPNTSGEMALRIMERVLQKIRQEPIVQAEGESFYITFSAGVAEWTAGISMAEWLQQADDAMYRAKQEGRNQVKLAEYVQQSESGKLVKHPTKSVLIADDDQIIRSILKSKLSHLPVQIIEVTDGEAALHVLRETSVDLCILDGVMPKLDGFSLLKQMKTEPQLSKIKVMMLSGRKQESDVVRGLMLGAEEYMSKPFSLVELEIRVKRLLGLE
ncbi:diguanylate cyclase [Brevibacillus dissolubilis]|uniref:diguanylate cyclase n=1 Tax=Brevibacillus dissolubilis TaxID=1844116 RepID=UPI0021005ADA|nr:diguanylate cyclase [Brevibacillus dissolubilis]